MQAQDPGHRLMRFFLASLLVSCFALAAFGRANSLMQDTQPDFEAAAKSAAEARDAGRKDEALRDYKRAVEIRPDWKEGWWYVGTLEYDQDRYAEAIPAFQKLLQLEPRAGMGWSFLGLCEFETKDYQNSFEHLKKGQTLGDADDPEISLVAKYHLALLMIRSGQFEAATGLLGATFGQGQISPQLKTALGLAVLRVPLLPDEVDPSKDGLLHAAGEAESQRVKGDPAKALELFYALASGYPNSSAAHSALARALQTAGHKDEAAREFASANKLAPEKFQVESEIAHVFPHRDSSKTGNGTGKSQEQFENLSRGAAEAQAGGQLDLAIRDLQEAVELRPDWDEGRWNLAMLCYSTAKYPKAITALKSWIERNPNFGTAWAVMGLSEFELKDYDNALIHLRRGEQLGFGGSAESVRLARYHLGLLLIRSGEFDEATRTLAPEAASGSMMKQIEFALGLVLLRMPFLPEQVENSKRSLVQTAGQISSLLQESKYDQAFPMFEGLLKDFPEAPFLHYAYGTAFAALSQYDEAETQFRAELKISPKSELPYVRMASLELKRRRPLEALNFAQTAVKLSQASGEAHYLLGRASLELGQEEAAVRELETASKLSPGSPEVHFNLAKAYAKAKLMDEAEQERAIFARLNALAEEQRSHSGSQSYSGSHSSAELAPTRMETEKPSKPEPPL